MRKILIPVDPSDYTKTALEYAALFAKPEKSIIEGVAIIDVLDVIEHAATYLPLPQGLDSHKEKEDQLLSETRAKAEEEMKQFARFCHEKHLKCNIKIAEGRPDYIIEKESLFNDLVIIGMRNYFHFEREDKPETSLNQILGHTITPILAVTKKFRPVNKVLFAYDGSMPSIKAIQRFAFMMRNYSYEAVLLTKSNNEMAAHEAFDKMEQYLEPYDNITVFRKWTQESLIKTFEKEFKNQVDMVVCGMHSQNLLKRFFVGSFPKYLIELNEIPVFIGQ